MARRLSMSSFRSKLQRLQSRQRQALGKLRHVAQNLERAERERGRRVNAAIDRCDAAARAHKNRVRENQQRLKNAIARLRVSHFHHRFTIKLDPLQPRRQSDHPFARQSCRRSGTFRYAGFHSDPRIRRNQRNQCYDKRLRPSRFGEISEKIPAATLPPADTPAKARPALRRRVCPTRR